MPMVVLYTHGTDYSTLVAILRLARFVALEHDRAQMKVSEKVHIVTPMDSELAAQGAQISTAQPHRGQR
jgi:hypothetical protein